MAGRRDGVLLGCLLAVAMAVPAHAHMVWIERDEGGPAKAYFGEPAEALHEKTGGLLDRIAAPRAFQAGGATLAVERRADHLEIAAAKPGDLRLVEEGAPREDKRNGGRTKVMFQAKAGRTETAPGLDLELVPTAAGADSFVLLLRGQPLAKTEVKVMGPPLWEKGVRTDDKGALTIPTPWAGRYVVEAAHVEEKPGGSGDTAFDRIRHVSTLSFTTQKGIAWTKP